MPLSQELSSSLQQLIKALLSSTTSPSNGAPRRYYSALFRELPDHDLYADYYIFIKEPRALNPILDSLHNGRYSSPQAVAYDLFLVWSNAREYNEYGSQVYNDADKLERNMERLWRDRVPPLPPFEALPRPGMLYPAQTAASSNAAAAGGATAGAGASNDPAHHRIKIMSSSLTSAPTTPAASGSSSTPKLRLAGSLASAPAAPTPTPSASTSNPLTLKLAIKPPGTAHSASPALPSPSPQPTTPAAAVVATPTPPPPAAPSPAAVDDSAMTGVEEALPRPTMLHSHSSAGPPPPTPAPIPGPAPPQHRPMPIAAPTPQQPQAHKLPNGLLTDAESGWMGGEIEGDPVPLYLEILNTLREYTDSEGRQLAAPYLSLPDRRIRPEYFDEVEEPVALETIEQRALAREYEGPDAFDRDLFRVFENAKIFVKPDATGSEYADLVVLQRVYQELTKRVSALTPRPQTLTLSALASVVLGPGNCEGKDPVDGEPKTAQTRISMKDKIFLDHINFKGQVLRVGDWVHLLNPENPAKPIIAQIFKVYKRMDSPQRCLSVCWYYRPEETVHPKTRTFYESEVFKSGQFVDHAIEDFIDRCFVMFFTRYIRGRPKPPVWDDSMPLYVVEHRYKDEIHSFKKIKNWNSCVPEEIRKQEYALQTFAGGEPITLPRYPSPFLRGVVGPGHFGEALDEGGSKSTPNPDATPAPNAGGRYNSSAPLNPNANPQPTANTSTTPLNDFDAPLRGGGASFSRGASAPPEEHPLPPGSYDSIQSSAIARAQQYIGAGAGPYGAPPPPMPFLHSKDSLTPVEVAAQQESKFAPLPMQIRSKLRTDELGEVLWFTTPGRPEVSSGGETRDEKPSHSLEYLYWRAMQQQEWPGPDAMDVEL